MKAIASNAAVCAFVFGPGVIGTAWWWFMGSPESLWAWVWTIIVLL